MQKELEDNRDNRGKRHDLSIVVLGFLIAILKSTGKLNFSKIHRIMRRDYPSLMQDLGLTSSTCISRSQLIRILDRFDYRAFNRLNMHYFSKQINKNGLEWYAIDGKELRGSIDTQAGEKPGENVVFSVNHSHYQSEILGYYLGKKESEKTTVKRYFQDKIDLSGKAFSFDALHNSSILLEEIASKGGVYLALLYARKIHL